MQGLLVNTVKFGTCQKWCIIFLNVDCPAEVSNSTEFWWYVIKYAKLRTSSLVVNVLSFCAVMEENYDSTLGHIGYICSAEGRTKKFNKFSEVHHKKDH